ncbi:hypothetical protein Hanom_Chr07g00588371 [Helianthus anomalus]
MAITSEKIATSKLESNWQHHAKCLTLNQSHSCQMAPAVSCIVVNCYIANSDI